MKTWVTVRTQVEGFHQWPDAPSGRSYLGVPHRHLFQVEHSIAVAGWREIEFHDLLDVVVAALLGLDANYDGAPATGWSVDFGARSCEQIAVELIRLVDDRLDLGATRPQRCKVFEDGENGAEVETP